MCDFFRRTLFSAMSFLHFLGSFTTSWLCASTGSPLRGTVTPARHSTRQEERRGSPGTYQCRGWWEGTTV